MNTSSKQTISVVRIKLPINIYEFIDKCFKGLYCFKDNYEIIEVEYDSTQPKFKLSDISITNNQAVAICSDVVDHLLERAYYRNPSIHDNLDAMDFWFNICKFSI